MQDQMKRFHKAASAGDCKKVEKMIAEGFESFTTPNKHGMNSLHYCAWGARGYRVLNDGRNSPMLSTSADYVKIAKILIANGVSVSSKTLIWFTPLHHACCDGNPEMVLELLSNGADTISLNSSGYTAAELALVHGHPSVAALIGAEVGRRKIVAEEEVRRAQYEAFAMGHVDRLGAGSRVRWLDPGVVRMVLEFM